MDLILASMPPLTLSGVKEKIVYIPEGNFTINPTVNGKPGEITSRIDPSKGDEIAASLNEQLKVLNSKNVRPFIDFDHEGGISAGECKNFSYESGRGIVLEMDWSGAGKEAIEAKNYRYFSPTVLIAKDGTPAGLPDSGPIGALVNDPAFREIERIAAARANTPEPTKQKNNINMSDILVKAGLLDVAEGAQSDALDVATKRVSAMKDSMKDGDKKYAEAMKTVEEYKAKYEAMKKEMEAMKTAKAEKTVKDAVAAGHIAPKDTDSQEFWKKNLLIDHDAAEKALFVSAKKVEASDMTGKVITSQATPTDLDTKVASMIQAGNAKDKNEALAKIMESDPDAYEAFATSLSK